MYALLNKGGIPVLISHAAGCGRFSPGDGGSELRHIRGNCELRCGLWRQRFKTELSTNFTVQQIHSCRSREILCVGSRIVAICGNPYRDRTECGWQ